RRVLVSVGGDGALVDVPGNLDGEVVGVLVEYVLELRELMLFQQAEPRPEQAPATVKRITFPASMPESAHAPYRTASQPAADASRFSAMKTGSHRRAELTAGAAPARRPAQVPFHDPRDGRVGGSRRVGAGVGGRRGLTPRLRSEEHTSELQ